MGLSTAAVLPVIIINLVFTLSVPGISIAGHLGGLVVGGLVGGGLAYAPKERRSAIQAATIVIRGLALSGLSSVADGPAGGVSRVQRLRPRSPDRYRGRRG